MKANSYAVLALLCVLSGCASLEYDVLVEPAGKDFYRQITVGLEGVVTTNIESEDGQAVELHWASECEGGEIGRMARLYHATVPATQSRKDGLLRGPSKPVTFARKFSGKTPGDLGGAGFYTRIKTNLGSCHLYMERIRGCDDQARALQEAFGQADRIVDKLSDWFKAQLAGDRNLPRLVRFLDKEFRNDAIRRRSSSFDMRRKVTSPGPANRTALRGSGTMVDVSAYRTSPQFRITRSHGMGPLSWMSSSLQ